MGPSTRPDIFQLAALIGVCSYVLLPGCRFLAAVRFSSQAMLGSTCRRDRGLSARKGRTRSASIGWRSAAGKLILESAAAAICGVTSREVRGGLGFAFDSYRARQDAVPRRAADAALRRVGRCQSIGRSRGGTSGCGCDGRCAPRWRCAAVTHYRFRTPSASWAPSPGLRSDRPPRESSLPASVLGLVGLEAEQDVLVGHRLGVVGVEAERLVPRRRCPSGCSRPSRAPARGGGL